MPCPSSARRFFCAASGLTSRLRTARARVRWQPGPGSCCARGSCGLLSSLHRPSNLFNFMFFALFFLYATRSLQVQPGALGLVMGAGAIGGVIGSVLTRRLAARFGVGWAYVVGCVLFPLPLVLVPLASGPIPLILAMLFIAEFVSGFGVMVLDISGGSIYAAVIPDHLRSRVMGAFQAVNYGTRPVGALLGGALGTVIGLRPALWIATVGGTLAFLWVLPSSLPRFRMPAPST